MAEPDIPPKSMDDITLTTPSPPHRSDGRGCKPDQSHGDTPVEHQLTGKNKEGNRHERKNADAGDDPLKGDHHGQAFIKESGDRSHPQRKGHRQTDDDTNDKYSN